MTREQDLDITPLTDSSFEGSPLDDFVEGSGIHVKIGEGSAQVFPASRVVRGELGGSRVRLTGLASVTAEDKNLNAYGESEQHRSALRLDENALVFVTSRKGAPSPDVASLSPGELAASESESIETPEVDADMISGGEDGERIRVHLTGRIGYKPRFRETPNGTRVGQFALAVHEQAGQTAWHSIVAFGERAKKVEEAGFTKGDEVTVVGYPHERERQNPKTGETKTITEIYAAVVKRPKEKDSASPKESSGEAD
jgi:Single-strand binding protein family